MTDRINVALALFDNPDGSETWEADRSMGQALSVIANAARRFVDGWETCPTCNGYGDRLIETDGRYHHEPCPDCVDGMIPSPELAERVAKTVAALMIGETDVYYEDAPHHWNGAIRAGLLASRRGEQ